MALKRDRLKALESQFGITRPAMLGIIRAFHRQMAAGLAGRPGDLKMLPAYADRPSGRETGEYLALDLGGTNFRVLELELKGSGRAPKTRAMKYAIPEGVMRGDGKRLFSFLASCIGSFLKRYRIDARRYIPLGFTFSFGVDQDRLDRGRLIAWTKGFSARGVAGRDVVELLVNALRREGLGNISVAALINDTVGTLVAGAYDDSDCDMGVILGTGTNACYVEKTAAIKKADLSAYHDGAMIVNIEWGNFSRLRRTVYDIELDRNSLNSGRQALEKMISGMYLGELVRLVLVDLADRGAIFRSCGPAGFSKYMSFGSEYVSGIVSDNSATLGRTGEILRVMGVDGSSAPDRRAVRAVCRMVSRRAARLSAAAIAAVVTKMDPKVTKRHVVAIDGSVYEKHPGFSRSIESALREILGRRACNVRLVLTKDGSGMGAAITAAAAVQHRKA